MQLLNFRKHNENIHSTYSSFPYTIWERENTLRIGMSIVAGILVVLFGKVFRKFEQQEFSRSHFLNGNAH